VRQYRAYDANDLLCGLSSWQRADISDNALYGGDLPQALAAIQARAIIMPCSTDLCFPPEDSRTEVQLLPRAELRILESKFGHFAGGPGRMPRETAFVEAAILDLLSAP
jgi:homoserine O-acetyltransferase